MGEKKKRESGMTGEIEYKRFSDFYLFRLNKKYFHSFELSVYRNTFDLYN